MAQMALETGFGASELARNANNYGGHKYGKDLHGDNFYIKDGDEFIDGKEVTEKDVMWGKYNTIQDFIRQHFNWFTSNPTRANIYKNVLSATTADRQVYYLMGTYATDLPRANSLEYYKKLMNIIDQYNLTQYDSADNTQKRTDKVSTFTPTIIDRRQ